MSSLLAVAAALFLFVRVNEPTPEDPNQMTVRGSAAGFTASIIVYDESPQAAPAGSRHQIKVNVTADADGFVALFRQEGQTEPIFVSNLEYKKAQGDMHMLEENAVSGTRYCIIGAKDHVIVPKKNVIIGNLIPAGSGAPANCAARKELDRRKREVPDAEWEEISRKVVAPR